jgi:hypothetical protein
MTTTIQKLEMGRHSYNKSAVTSVVPHLLRHFGLIRRRSDFATFHVAPIVKLPDGLDDHTRESGQEMGGEKNGICFHTITTADGGVLVASDSPLGNIRIPGSIEKIRYFQAVLRSGRSSLFSAETDPQVGPHSSIDWRSG